MSENLGNGVGGGGCGSDDAAAVKSVEVRVQNYIFGQFEETETYIDSYEPATGKIWALVPNSNDDVVNRAVVAAKNALGAWSTGTSLEVRAKVLLKVADMLEGRMEEFALAESRDQGKPMSLAMAVDIPRAVLNLRAFAQGQKYIPEMSNTMGPAGVLSYTHRTAAGVAGLITPWNLPIYLLTFKLGPALMSGCTVVCKPSEMTSVSAWMLCGLFHEAGLPKGVLNLVCGYGNTVGEAMVKHPDTKVISFTGSTLIGQRIAGIAAPMMKKVSLELGGKNAAVVFEDADLAKAVPTLINAGFKNQGEICLCTSRIFVHEDVYDQFVSEYVSAAKKITVGRGRKVFMGALVSKGHLEKVKGYVKVALEEGGTVHCGETAATGDLVLEDDDSTCLEQAQQLMADGYFMAPTVITGLKDQSRCMQEEIFGPVVCIAKFSGSGTSGEDDVVARVNDTPYGLCASVWTGDAARIQRVAQKLEVGTVWQNCWLVRDLTMPFGGCKRSGTGREGIFHSIETYTDVKTICLKL